MDEADKLCSKMLKLIRAIEGNVNNGFYEYAEIFLDDLDELSKKLRIELNKE